MRTLLTAMVFALIATTAGAHYDPRILVCEDFLAVASTYEAHVERLNPSNTLVGLGLMNPVPRLKLSGRALEKNESHLDNLASLPLSIDSLSVSQRLEMLEKVMRDLPDGRGASSYRKTGVIWKSKPDARGTDPARIARQGQRLAQTLNVGLRVVHGNLELSPDGLKQLAARSIDEAAALFEMANVPFAVKSQNPYKNTPEIGDVYLEIRDVAGNPIAVYDPIGSLRRLIQISKDPMFAADVADFHAMPREAEPAPVAPSDFLLPPR